MRINRYTFCSEKRLREIVKEREVILGLPHLELKTIPEICEYLEWMDDKSNPTRIDGHNDF